MLYSYGMHINTPDVRKDFLIRIVPMTEYYIIILNYQDILFIYNLNVLGHIISRLLGYYSVFCFQLYYNIIYLIYKSALRAASRYMYNIGL